MSVSSVAIQITLVDLISRGLTGVRDRLKGLAESSHDTKMAFDRMGKSFKYAAMSAIATRGMYQGMKPAVAAASDLQAELIGTRAELMKSGKSAKQLNKEMADIKKTAFSVQAWTPFDMGQIVALEKTLVKAGANINDVIGETGAAAATAALAVYENLDPAQTGKALIGIGTPFKITADKYMELADTIARAASASTVGAGEIAETAKYAAGPMAKLGKSSKEMLALSAMMAQVGVTGTMAGTSLKNFFLKATGHKVFQDAHGNLKSTVDIIDILRKNLKGMGTAKQVSILKKMFGEEGMPVALAILEESKGSYEDIIKAMEESASLQKKINLAMGGFGKQFNSLGGTARSTMAQLFLPALVPLTKLISKTNEFVAAIGKAATEKESLGKAVSGLSLGAIGAGGLATVGMGATGLFYLRKVLKGTGGIKGLFTGGANTAAGIAKGKAVEAATGVTPVFVTNWPVAMGAAGVASDIAAGSSGGFMKKAGSALKKLPLLAAGKVALAGGAGYGVGTYINKGLGALVEKTTGGMYKGPGFLGDALYDLFHSNEKNRPAETKNNINLNVRIDEKGRVFTESDSMNTELNTNLKRGKF